MNETRNDSSQDQPRVVLTRAAEHNFVLGRRLAELGIASIDVPMIEVGLPGDQGQALEAAVAGLDLYHWLVVTSANGVRAVSAMMEQVGMTWPDHLRLAVVGSATAEVARSHGWPVHFMPSAATAKDLVVQFPEPDVPQGPVRVLAALAELGAATVKKGLTRKGFKVDHVIAYRTVAPGRSDDPEADRDIKHQISEADAVTFTSPSAATRFVNRFGVDLVPPIVVCIGPRTAKRCDSLKISVTAIADPHSEPGLIEALQRALRESR